MSSGRPPTLWCDLIVAATPSAPPDSITSRVERALHEEAATSPSLRASSSKTRMNSRPMIFRFSSGSSTPSSRSRNRSCACTCTSGTWKWSPKTSTTCSASFFRAASRGRRRHTSADRRRPCGRGAPRPRESTPPESAQSTRSPPTCARIRSTCSSITARRRPGGRRSRDLVEEVLQHLHARAACARPRDGTGRRRAPVGRLERADRRGRRAGDDARSPRAARRRESRWLIQTVCFDGVSFRQRRLLDLELGLAELRTPVRSTRAPEIERHQLHAVADAERGHAELEDARVDARRILGVDRRGPAD